MRAGVSVGIDHDTARFAAAGHHPVVAQDGPASGVTREPGNC